MTDFGLSKCGMEPTDLTDSFCGSPEYMAPEIVLGRGYNYSIDFYTLGALLHEFLVGYPPYYDEDPEVIVKNIKTKDLKISLKLSKMMRVFLYSLLCKNPKQRTQNFGDIKTYKLFETYNWEAISEKTSLAPIPISLYSSNINDEFSSHAFRDNEPKKFRKKFEDFYYLSGSSVSLLMPQLNDYVSHRSNINSAKGLSITQSHENFSSSKRILQSMEILNSLKKSANQARSIERNFVKTENNNEDNGFFAELKKRLEANPHQGRSFIKSTENPESTTRKLFMSMLDSSTPANNNILNSKISEEDEILEKEFSDRKLNKKEKSNSRVLNTSSTRKMNSYQSEGNVLKGKLSPSEFTNLMKRLRGEKPNFQKMMGSFYGKFQKVQSLKEKFSGSKEREVMKTSKDYSDHFNSTIKNLTENSINEKSEFLHREKKGKTSKIQSIRPSLAMSNNFSGSKIKTEGREPIITALKNSKSTGNFKQIGIITPKDIRKSLEFISKKKSPNKGSALKTEGSKMKDLFDGLLPEKRGSVDRHTDYRRSKNLKTNTSESSLKVKSFNEILKGSNSLAGRLKSKAIY